MPEQEFFGRCNMWGGWTVWRIWTIWTVWAKWTGWGRRRRREIFNFFEILIDVLILTVSVINADFRL